MLLYTISRNCRSYPEFPAWVEVQFRTIAMDFWASLEHKLKYKKDIHDTGEIEQRLKACADSIEALDYQMQEIRDKIDISDIFYGDRIALPLQLAVYTFRRLKPAFYGLKGISLVLLGKHGVQHLQPRRYLPSGRAFDQTGRYHSSEGKGLY